MEEEKKAYSTRDIYLSATLVTLGFEITKVDYQIEGDRRKPVGYFNFDPTEKFEAAVQEYWKGNCTIEPRAFVTNLWSLKSMVMNEYKNPNKEINQNFMHS